MQKYSDIVLFNGQPLSGASVTVSNYPSGTLATIYIDNGITQGPNPITTDLNGRYSFYAANGRYSLQISYPNALTQTILDFPLEYDPSTQTVTPSYPGGVARNINSKIYDVVSVLDFGAVADGVTDNSAAFTAAVAVARKILVPAGTYATKAFSLPSNTNLVGEGVGLTNIIPATGTTGGAFISSLSTSHVEISEMSINVSKATYPLMNTLYFSSAAYLYIHDLLIPNGGIEGIYTLNCTDVIVERCSVSNCTNRCISHDGPSSARTKTRNCYVSNPGGADHGIAVSGGTDHEITDNYSTLTTIFGFNAYQSTRVKITGNTSYNSTREGINATDSSEVTIANNIVAWDTTTSQDFGMSISGQAIATNYIMVHGNKVINCGKSGIGLAGTGTSVQNCSIQDNIIENSNRLNLGVVNGGGAGVIVYGALAQNNLVSNNKIFDNIGFLQFGVYEWTSSGTPSANKFYNNDVIGNAQGATSITANSYEALTTLNAVSYTPTITSSTGTLTTASATGSYLLNGKMVFVRVTGTITTNGTGATSIVFSLPFAVAAGSIFTMAGREAAVTGKMVSGTASAGGTQLTCFFYDNSYPGANGASISLSGWYVRT